MGNAGDDLSGLSGLTELTSLDLMDTPVSDLGPLISLTGLTSLNLAGTQVSDLSLLAGLTELRILILAHTRVSNLSPLAGMGSLAFLDLTGTAVEPAQLASALRGKPEMLPEQGGSRWPSARGVSFAGCAATREDARLAEIAGIGDDGARVLALFAHLGIETSAESESELTVAGVPKR